MSYRITMSVTCCGEGMYEVVLGSHTLRICEGKKWFDATTGEDANAMWASAAAHALCAFDTVEAAQTKVVHP